MFDLVWLTPWYTIRLRGKHVSPTTCFDSSSFYRLEPLHRLQPSSTSVVHSRRPPKFTSDPHTMCLTACDAGLAIVIAIVEFADRGPTL